MDKRKLYRDIAKSAGIKAPEIEYHRERQAYSIGITIPVPNGIGFYAPSVGLYYSPEEAQSRIVEDLKAFLLKHPEAQKNVTKTYNIVTKGEALSPKELSRDLLNRLLTGQGNLALDDELRQMAQSTLEYIEKLEAHRPKPKATGVYRSRLPEQEKKALAWEQPSARQQPIYRFEIDCKYCGRHVIIERYSPHEPRHCGQENCQVDHDRELAKIRKQRQRARQKGS